MNYQDALERLQNLRTGYKELIIEGKSGHVDSDELCMIYGELEEIINRFAGIDRVEVRTVYGPVSVYPNYIAARLFSGRTVYGDEGYWQLLKIIGKVGQYAQDPTIPQIEHSVTNLIQILRRFRECCQYLPYPPQEEKDVQAILWTMLRSHFDRLEKEETLPRFASKSYRPDFGIPDLRVLVEAKFIGSKTKVPSIQEGILGDIPGYLNSGTDYDCVIVLVYDAAHKLRDPGKFVRDLKSVEGIIDVVVVPGVGGLS